MSGVHLTAVGVFFCAVMAALSLHADTRIGHAIRIALRRPRTWVIALPTIVLVLAVGVPFVYTRIILGPPPPPLTFDDLQTEVPAAQVQALPEQTPVVAAAADVAVAAPAATVAPAAGPAGPIDGLWRVGDGSQAGYSIDDTVMGQTSRVVGRTRQVSGEAKVLGATGLAVRVDVDMASVLCDCVHDSKYRDMLEVETYPKSTFVLTEEIKVAEIPPPGTVVELPVRGDFTIHGVTREVRFPVQVTQINERIAVKGSIPVRLEDYNIENPDAGAFGSLSDAAIDLLLGFDRVS